jgi:hypothetical protein
MRIMLYEKFNTDYEFLTFGNFNNKPLPKTDDELRYDRQLSWKAITLYDEIFGTNVKETYGEDYDLLLKDPSIKRPTSGDVIKKLIENSYLPNWYSKFNIKTNSDNISGLLLDQFINHHQGKKVSWKPLINYLKKEMKTSQRKKQFVYNLYKPFGSQFNQEMTKEILNVKKDYEIDNKEEFKPMDERLEKTWWKCIQWSMNHYKDFFKLDEMIERACNKMIEILDNKSDLIEKWIDNKIERFKKGLE